MLSCCFKFTFCPDISPNQLFLLTPLLVLRNDVKLMRINYGYSSYGSLGPMHQVLEISFITVIVI